VTNISKEPIPKTWLSITPTAYTVEIGGAIRYLADAIGCVAEKLKQGQSPAVIAKECGISIGQVSRIRHRIVGERRYVIRAFHDRRAPLAQQDEVPAGVVFMCICGGRSATPTHPGCERRQGLDRRLPDA
jgi:hypothetical protein